MQLPRHANAPQQVVEAGDCTQRIQGRIEIEINQSEGLGSVLICLEYRLQAEFLWVKIFRLKAVLRT
jgi:hypothetical protein